MTAQKLSRRTVLAILFLFLLNFIAGLAFLNEGLFHCDSVILAQAVENTYKQGALQPALNGRYGSVILNSILYFPYYLAGGNADFATRLSSVLFHSLSIVVLFLFVKELFGDSLQAFFSGLLFSFAPFYFGPNTYGKEHGMSMFFLLLSLYLLVCAGRTKSVARLILASIFYGFSISIRESMLIAFALFSLFYFSPSVHLRPVKITIAEEKLKPLFLVSAFGPFLAIFGAIFFSYLNTIIFRTIFVRSTNTVSFISLFSPVLHRALGDLLTALPSVLFLFFVIGLVTMAKTKNLFQYLSALLWLLLIFYFGNTNGYAARHLDLITIPIVIFASYALRSLYAKDKLVSAAFLVYIVSSMFAYMYPMLEFRHRYNGEKQFALFVKEHTEENAVIIAMDDSYHIQYYAERESVTHPVGNAEETNKFILQLKERLKEGRPLYIIESGFGYDPEGVFRNALLDNFKMQLIGRRLAEDFHHPELQLQTYNEGLFKLQLAHQ